MEQGQHGKDNSTQRKRNPRVITAKGIGEALRRRFLLLRDFNQREDAVQRALLEPARRAND
jgi:hypothetical protein